MAAPAAAACAGLAGAGGGSLGIECVVVARRVSDFGTMVRCVKPPAKLLPVLRIGLHLCLLCLHPTCMLASGVYYMCGGTASSCAWLYCHHCPGLMEPLFACFAFGCFSAQNTLMHKSGCSFDSTGHIISWAHHLSWCFINLQALMPSGAALQLVCVPTASHTLAWAALFVCALVRA